MRKDAELSFTFNPAQLQVSVTKTAPLMLRLFPPRCQQSGPSVPGCSRLPASSWATASRVLGGAGLFTPALSAATPDLPQPRTAARLPSHLSCEVRRSIQPCRAGGVGGGQPPLERSALGSSVLILGAHSYGRAASSHAGKEVSLSVIASPQIFRSQLIAKKKFVNNCSGKMSNVLSGRLVGVV